MVLATTLITITIAGVFITSFFVPKNMSKSDVDMLVDAELDERKIPKNLRQDMKVTRRESTISDD